MDDILRKRLSKEEVEQYDLFDRRASMAAHFVVWPGIAGLVSYSASRIPSAILCLVIVLAAIPVMVIMGRHARKLRERAEGRYAAIMGFDGDGGDT